MRGTGCPAAFPAVFFTLFPQNFITDHDRILTSYRFRIECTLFNCIRMSAVKADFIVKFVVNNIPGIRCTRKFINIVFFNDLDSGRFYGFYIFDCVGTITVKDTLDG